MKPVFSNLEINSLNHSPLSSGYKVFLKLSMKFQTRDVFSDFYFSYNIFHNSSNWTIRQFLEVGRM